MADLKMVLWILWFHVLEEKEFKKLEICSLFSVNYDLKDYRYSIEIIRNDDEMQ
jgi:hypothetical protein